MDKSVCRYSRSQFESMGLSDEFNGQSYDLLYRGNCDMKKIARGKFGEILDVLYDSNETSLDNNLRALVSENAPDHVKAFVNNVLLCDVPALRAAPDDETAFNCLIPRSAQTSRELAPYLDTIRSLISEKRADTSTSNQQQEVSSNS